MKRNIRYAAAMVFVALSVCGADVDKPNILFIISDDLTAALGCYGHPQCKTPNIDRIAARGVRFDNVYCMNPVCGPSRASLMTGRYPGDLDCYSNRDSKTLFQDPSVTSMTEPFRREGWFVARVSKVYHMGIPGDIARGGAGADHAASWDVAVNIKDLEQNQPGKYEHLTPKMKSSGMAFKVVETEAGALELADGKAATQAIGLLREHGDKPFFLAVGFVRPHVPLVAPPEFFEPYLLDGIELQQVPENDLADIPEAHQFDVNEVKYGMSEEQQLKALRAYYASISYMDAQVGRLLDELERLGLHDDTIVVFTSDHGYHLGEHHMWQKQSLFENSSRVPFIVSVPWLADAHGKGCDRIAEHIDLFPTLTDLCGIEAPADLPGESMQNLLKDPERGSWNKTAAYTLNSKGGETVRNDRFRLIVWHDGKSGTELYNHEKDPGEFTNLADNPEYAAKLKEMRALLDQRRRVAKTDVKAYLEKVPPAFDKQKFLKNQQRKKKQP
ncbi:Choline-sulfatase [Pontiella desulfatans]|uniref:Choline-sulfatase n=1 Tax=Pontiella desulfatans TaxID=2750659 RepID=A0A6C2TXM3_PONDE|nr:sulfatase [Pontiella desulfatans]SPS73658.1 sulfatase S1_7 [Kiritimatiellales bacterium]VGO12353.1 Choline-sulfatase [Pontiella desulfatans]